MKPLVSTDTTAVENSVSNTVEAQNVYIEDNSNPYSFKVDTPLETPRLYSQTVGTNIQDWFKRPVLIYSYNLSESDARGNFNVDNIWSTYFNNTYVKHKINNYAYFRGKMKIKIIINASPFYYGLLRACYIPNYGTSNLPLATELDGLINYSQLPGVWIYPGESRGAEMEIPLFINKDWVNLTSLSEVQNLGILRYFIYAPLRMANGITGTGITMKIYGWMDDIELSGPTYSLAVQGSDEYSVGPVQRISSAIATVSEKFVGTPMIGAFALATHIGASAVSSIASIFGWSNVPNIKNIEPVAIKTTPYMASTEISYPIEKLTVDAKNELTVDPAAFGLDSKDELDISYIVSKSSYLTYLTWTSSTTVDTLLFTSAVTPVLFGYSNPHSSYNAIYATPMAHLSSLFNEWRGDIIYNFKVICSPYHRGRLRVTYDPVANITVATDTTNVCFTKIIDISENKEFDIRVPYMQSLHFLSLKNMTTGNRAWYNGDTTTWYHTPGYTNGTLTVRCLTELTAPATSSTIEIIVSVRGAENLEFANPVMAGSGKAPLYTYLAPQAGDEIDVEETGELVFGRPSIVHPQRYLIYFGERIQSLRKIMRRQTYYYTITFTTGTGVSISKFCKPRFPVTPGYTNVGIDLMKGIVTPANTYAYNCTNFTPATWMMPCYAGVRGSMIETAVPIQSDSVKVMDISRQPGYTNVYERSVSSIGQNLNVAAMISQNRYSSGAPGMAVTSLSTNSTVSVLLPMYSKYKWQYTKPALIQSPSSTYPDGQSNDFNVLTVTSHTTGENYPSVMLYSAIGTDFQLLWYLAVPKFYIMTDTPVIA